MTAAANKKTPAAAATAHEGSDLTRNGDEAHMTDISAPVPSVGTIRLEDRGQSTGITFATMNGEHLPQRDYLRVIIARDDFLDAARSGNVPFTVAADDVAEHNRRIYAARAAAEERRRDAELLAAAKAAAVTDAADLLDRLDLDHLTGV